VRIDFRPAQAQTRLLPALRADYQEADLRKMRQRWLALASVAAVALAERSTTMPKIRKKWLVLATLVTVALVSGVAYASIPDGSGTIHGCYAKSTGALRVIDTGGCKSAELALTWAQQGTPGTPGTNGTNGAPGTNGTNGAPGTNGTNGVSGYQIVTDSVDFPVGSSAAGDLNVGCPDNKVVVGGGGRINDSNFSEEPGNFDVEQSFPGPQGHSWTITYHANGLGLAFTVTVFAICENPSS
jgi:hypothetical protein